MADNENKKPAGDGADKAAKAPKADAKAKGGKGKQEAKPTGPTPTYKRTAPPRMKTKYEKEVVANPKVLESAVEELRVIAGQAPVVTRAKKAIANFKLREGLKIGTMVTLRRERMWEFLDRLINLALPRVRDFKGVSARAFDGRGNYSLGIREQIIFPEINYDKVDKIKGMNVTIVTTARTDEEGRALLRYLGMPFRQQ